MSTLYLVRLPVDLPALLRFAAGQEIHDPDPYLGYTLHAWLAALFGQHAPKPFRFLDRRREVLGYVRSDADALLVQAHAFASPQAWAALDRRGVASKPMPEAWTVGQRLRLETLVCPLVRRDQNEKDAYLSVLDRLGDAAPARAEVYRKWFLDRCAGALQVEQMELRGVQARTPLLRRTRGQGRRSLKTVERPHALFHATATIADNQRFSELLARGIGRHRAFGFGMVLLAPPA